MLAKRMLIAVPSLVGVVIVTFLLTRALPISPDPRPPRKRSSRSA
jgi:ABC-type dipeptide/oligopeptide/nickel transport system permease component